MKVSILGAGNVGVAIAADLSIKGHSVTLIKTSRSKSNSFGELVINGGCVSLKENSVYTHTRIEKISEDLSDVKDAEVVFVTIQSTYHEELFKKIYTYLNGEQIVVCICSYMSSFYMAKYCKSMPTMVETTGPYLEGRVEMNDWKGKVVFRVGCRLSRSPLSVYQGWRKEKCMKKLHELYKGFSDDYSVVESALLNPNLVLHTVGSVMSLPRIEFSNGDFCMYREAYCRKNNTTFNVMLKLDEEKKSVLRKLHCSPVDIFVAGGFLGNPTESFYSYSESSDRAKSPTSVHSRYITEDVSQGLVLLESIAKTVGVNTPITTALIDIASVALGEDFRASGRTIGKLGAEDYIEKLCG